MKCKKQTKTEEKYEMGTVSREHLVVRIMSWLFLRASVNLRASVRTAVSLYQGVLGIAGNSTEVVISAWFLSDPIQYMALVVCRMPGDKRASGLVVAR